MHSGFLETVGKPGHARMAENAVRQNGIGRDEIRDKTRELPVGSELMIAFALGAGGWYMILKMFHWLAG